MQRRSLISLLKLLSGQSFVESAIPQSPFLSRTLTTLSNRSLSKPHDFYGIKSATNFRIFQDFREYSVDTDKEVDKINFKFAAAREEIEAALESKETVYFDEEAECARAAVNEVLEMYEGLLEKLPESERGGIQRSMGLKIEQLKAELEQLND